MSDIYEFHIKGHLDSQWSDWFEGLSISHHEGSKTVLVGTVADQALLHGLLNKIRDLGLVLLKVKRLETRD